MEEFTMRRKLSVFAIAMLTVAVVLGASSRADAAFIAYICDDAACTGGGDVIVQDNQLGDSIAAPGAISFSGTVGGLTLVVNTSFSKPLIGSTTSPELDITYSAIGSGTAYLYASDTDFTGDGGTVTATVGGTGPGTITTTLYGGNSNANLDRSNQILSFTGFGTATGQLSPTADPYSLTLGVRVSQSGIGTISTGDANIAVPEPASVLMLGLGLLGSAGAIRRRFGIR
jgi:hypothetical protein